MSEEKKVHHNFIFKVIFESTTQRFVFVVFFVHLFANANVIFFGFHSLYLNLREFHFMLLCFSISKLRQFVLCLFLFAVCTYTFLCVCAFNPAFFRRQKFLSDTVVLNVIQTKSECKQTTNLYISHNKTFSFERTKRVYRRKQKHVKWYYTCVIRECIISLNSQQLSFSCVAMQHQAVILLLTSLNLLFLS